MLNINITKLEEDTTGFNIDVQNIRYPFYFERKNICVSCGAEGTLKFINIFGKEAKHEIHPFESLKCSRCGALYSIKWDKDEEDGKLYPSGVDKSIVRDFLNNFKKKKDMEKTLS